MKFYVSRRHLQTSPNIILKIRHFSTLLLKMVCKWLLPLFSLPTSPIFSSYFFLIAAMLYIRTRDAIAVKKRWKNWTPADTLDILELHSFAHLIMVTRKITLHSFLCPGNWIGKQKSPIIGKSAQFMKTERSLNWGN